MTSPKLTGRGGPGRGQGRKPAPPHLRRSVKITVYLTESEAYLCEVLGNGSAGQGVRRMLDDEFARTRPDSEYEATGAVIRR